MPIHLYNLLARAFMSIPAALGSNWFGLVFTVIVVIIGEVIGGYLFGWQAVMTNWKKVTGIGFAALGVGYTLVFGWCVVTTTYVDHNSLSAHIRELNGKVKSADSHEVAAVQLIKNDLAQTKFDCAKTEGKNESLSKQASDQQGTINNCQEKALALLTPPPERLQVFNWGDIVTSEIDHKKTFILTSNKAHVITRIRVGCGAPIKTGDAHILDAGAYSGGANVDHGAMDVSFQMPVWDAGVPMRVDVEYTSSRDIQCQFQLR
jgi:hypothetical protein